VQVDATQDLSALQALGKAVASDTFVLRQAAINPALNVLSSNAVAADLLLELLAKLHQSKKQVPSWDQVWLLKLCLLIHFRVTEPILQQKKLDLPVLSLDLLAYSLLS
jgi:hypothetical protein